MNLQQIQAAMQQFLAGASAAAAGVQPGHPGLSVYQNNYRAQLVGCLQHSYPHLHTFMGADAFHYAAVSHIGRRPPHGWTLDAYGDTFGDSLRELFPDNPDLAELAWIEWALGLAFIAADAAPVSAAALAGADWDRAGLVFTPSLAARTVTTNAVAIWQALQAGAAAPESAMLEQAAGVIVWRRGFLTCVRAVETDELDALGVAATGRGFSRLCDELAERDGPEQGIALAGALLADWLASELVVGIVSAGTLSRPLAGVAA